MVGYDRQLGKMDVQTISQDQRSVDKLNAFHYWALCGSFSSFQSYEDSNTLLLASSLGKDIQDNVENFISTENIATTLYTAENVTEYILNIANEDLTDYSRNFIVGFKNSKNDKNQFYSDKQICENVGSPPDNMLTVMYNPVPLHSRPLAINILSNVILKTLGKKAVIKR